MFPLIGNFPLEVVLCRRLFSNGGHLPTEVFTIRSAANSYLVPAWFSEIAEIGSFRSVVFSCTGYRKLFHLAHLRYNVYNILLANCKPFSWFLKSGLIGIDLVLRISYSIKVFSAMYQLFILA